MRGLSKKLSVGMVGLFLIGLGCSGPVREPQNAREAIEFSKKKFGEGAQMSYLVEQAHLFIDQKDYKSAIVVCKHAAEEFGEESEELKDVVERLKKEMVGAAKQKMREVKQRLR